jgi:hypothetical protein
MWESEGESEGNSMESRREIEGNPKGVERELEGNSKGIRREIFIFFQVSKACSLATIGDVFLTE